MNTRSFLRAVCLACISIVTASAVFSQTSVDGQATVSTQPSEPKSDGDRVMFVEVAGLTQAHYTTLRQVTDEAGDLTIRQACVPAGILMVAIPSTNITNLENNFSAFRDIVYNQTGLSTSKLLAEYSEESFLDRCKTFRGGN